MKTFLILLEGVSQYFVGINSPTCNLKINNSLPESTCFSYSGVTLFQPFSVYIVQIMRYAFSESEQKLVRFFSTRSLTLLEFSEPSWLTIVVGIWATWLWLLLQKMCLPTSLPPNIYIIVPCSFFYTSRETFWNYIKTLKWHHIFWW